METELNGMELNGMDDALLRPVVDDDGAPFWEYAARGELRIQACASPECGKLRFPPRPCCPHCRSFESEWRATSGRGRIWSYVLPHPPLLPAYAAQAPYNAVVVELTDAPGIRLVGNVVSGPDAPLNSVDPGRLRIGAPVRAVFCPVPSGIRGVSGTSGTSGATGASGASEASGIPGAPATTLVRWVLER